MGRPVRHRVSFFALLAAAALSLSSCSNNPYPDTDGKKNVFYTSFSEEPKTFDPAVSYSEDQYEFIGQIYEPPMQYHCLKRPYTLVPCAAEKTPEPQYFDKDGKALPADAPDEQIVKAVYEIHLRKDLKYMDHPCFAKNADGSYPYHSSAETEWPPIEHPNDLPLKGTRIATAADYVYQIKRLASPLLECPIASNVSTFVDGFEDLQKELEGEVARIRKERKDNAGVFYNQEADERDNPIYLDYRKFDLKGAQVADEFTFKITLSRKYPQLRYWLAMPFFCPMPWEAERFFNQPAAAKQNLTLKRFPVGTGPYYLAVNRGNFRMILRRNPNFHDEYYPTDGSPGDEEAGYLDAKGKKLPFLDEAVYVLEKESVPRWAKFMQGYYDTSGIAENVFDQAVKFSGDGGMGVSDEMSNRKIRLNTIVESSTFYFGFNMLDETVGGYEDKKKKLRQALSIVFDYEEYLQIFRNNRGVAAQGPIPPGLFGYQEGKEGNNPFVYDWDEKTSLPKRKSIEYAKKLLAEAGYPEGRGKDGKQLILFYDSVDRGESKPMMDWIRKKFAQIGVDFQTRSTDYNRFQEKMLKGNSMYFSWGWNADYPDPENFLFLLHGPNGKVKFQGENASNYDNPRFSELFKKMETMDNTPERAAIIKEMLAIAREDAPWMWGFHPTAFGLAHEWLSKSKPLTFGNNSLKYRRLNPELRAQKRAEWNQPITWPVWTLGILIVVFVAPASYMLYRKDHEPTK